MFDFIKHFLFVYSFKEVDTEIRVNFVSATVVSERDVKLLKC